MGAYSRVTAEIEKRQAARFARVLDAIHSGRLWDIVRAELARDYASLFDNFLSFEKNVDTDFESRSKKSPTKTRKGSKSTKH